MDRRGCVAGWFGRRTDNRTRRSARCRSCSTRRRFVRPVRPVCPRRTTIRPGRGSVPDRHAERSSGVSCGNNGDCRDQNDPAGQTAATRFRSARTIAVRPGRPTATSAIADFHAVNGSIDTAAPSNRHTSSRSRSPSTKSSTKSSTTPSPSTTPSRLDGSSAGAVADASGVGNRWAVGGARRMLPIGVGGCTADLSRRWRRAGFTHETRKFCRRRGHALSLP